MRGLPHTAVANQKSRGERGPDEAAGPPARSEEKSPGLPTAVVESAGSRQEELAVVEAASSGGRTPGVPRAQVPVQLLAKGILTE